MYTLIVQSVETESLGKLCSIMHKWTNNLIDGSVLRTNINNWKTRSTRTFPRTPPDISTCVHAIVGTSSCWNSLKRFQFSSSGFSRFRRAELVRSIRSVSFVSRLRSVVRVKSVPTRIVFDSRIKCAQSKQADLIQQVCWVVGVTVVVVELVFVNWELLYSKGAWMCVGLKLGWSLGWHKRKCSALITSSDRCVILSIQALYEI